MSLDERYVPLTSLNQYFVAKDSGLPLAAGKILFYKDSSRATAKDVFQLTGTYGNYSYTSVTNEVTLSSVGTIQDSGGNNILLYGYPYDTSGGLDLYYIVCESAGSVAQWTRSAIPNLTASNDPTATTFSYNNELSNPQFTEYFLDEETSTEFVYSGATAKVTPIAPDWDLIVTGSGTLTVSRVAVAGSADLVTNPAYYMQVDVPSGVTTCHLRQRLIANSGIWAGDFLSSYIVAKKVSGSSSSIEMFYVPSSGSATTKILSTALTADFVGYPGGETIPGSNNSESGVSAYTDIIVSLPSQATTAFTSVQVVPTPAQPVANSIPYDQRSANHELAFMSNYYTPRLIEAQQKNMLTGWDFNLNPAQPHTNTVTIDKDSASGLGAYIWDQTICGRTTANVNAARNAVTGGFQMTTSATASTTDAFYLMQYIEGADAKRIIGNKLSINVSAFKTSVGDNVEMKVYLFAAPTTAAFPILSNSTVNPVTAEALSLVDVPITGIATLTGTSSSAGWFEIGRSNLNTAQATLSVISTNSELNTVDYDYSFNGWELTGDQMTNLDKIACVVTFKYVTDLTAVTVNSINLVPGDLSYRPLPETKAEVLRRCQYYFERSYEVGTAIGAVTETNALNIQQTMVKPGGTFTYFFNTVTFDYKCTKWSSPVLRVYNPTTGAENSVYTYLIKGITVASAANYVFIVAITSPVTAAHFTKIQKGKDILYYSAENGLSPGSLDDSIPFIKLHYTLDSRPGVI